MNVTASKLTPPKALWVFGDGNFEITSSLSTTHQFNRNPTHDTHVYATGRYDDGKPPKGFASDASYYSAKKNQPFSPSGQPITGIGLLSNGQYGAIKLFPERFDHTTNPVVIMAFKNHQAIPIDGNVFLYNKSNLTKNGVNANSVSYSSLLEHSNYTGISSQNVQNAPARPGYKAIGAWTYAGLQPGEERHIFTCLDSNATWGSIPDLLTGNYAAEFLIVVTGSGTFEIEQEYFQSATIESAHDPAFLTFSQQKKLEDTAKTTNMDLLFYNEGSMPVSNILVEFTFPKGWHRDDIQIIEQSIGPVIFDSEYIDDESGFVLKCFSKNTGLGKYNPLDDYTKGVIKIKTNRPLDQVQQTKATVRFDDLPIEEAQYILSDIDPLGIK